MFTTSAESFGSVEVNLIDSTCDSRSASTVIASCTDWITEWRTSSGEGGADGTGGANTAASDGDTGSNTANSASRTRYQPCTSGLGGRSVQLNSGRSYSL